jgi:hypothetical protein
MSDRHPAESKRVPVRLYLVTPPVEDAAAMARLLSEAVAAADVAAVLLRLADADERTLIDRVKTLLAPVQQAGAALLLDGRAELAVHTGADGAHLTGIDAFSDAVERLRPERIADDPDQLVLLEPDLHVDLDPAIAEDVRRAGREIVSDENFHLAGHCGQSPGD